jgi:hypothetical protein
MMIIKIVFLNLILKIPFQNMMQIQNLFLYDNNTITDEETKKIWYT